MISQFYCFIYYYCRYTVRLMFKIKRASNRNIVNNDILAESSNNLPERPPLH